MPHPGLQLWRDRLGRLASYRTQFQCHLRIEPADWQIYVEKYFDKNPLVPVAFRANTGDILCRRDAEAAWEAMTHSEFYRDWAKRLGIVDIMQATLDKTGSGIAMLSCARHERVGPAGPRELRLMATILPHLRRAVLISKALDLRTLQAAAFAETIDGLATGVFLVSAQGELVHANASGQAMLDRKEPLALESGILTATDPAIQRALTEAFASTKHGDAAMKSGGMALPLVTNSGNRYIAHALPLTSGARLDAGISYSASAAVFVREATIDVPATINTAGKLYGLTPAEERVLRGVIEVGGVPAIASMLGSSVSTVKTHLEHIFKKTGASGQADLVRLIAGFESAARTS
jgi:DNA-binding CsgD family transcriptional regulator/PAS domain-containing protein